MEFSLYPNFDEVFEDEKLRGFFYPLCKVTNYSPQILTPLYFVSSNGLFSDDKFKGANNASAFTCFYLHNGKYRFEGDLRLYKGHQVAREVFLMLDDDFKINGEQYLSEKMKPQKYIDALKSKINIDFGNLDVPCFFETFYSFSMNKLHYEKTNEFSIYNEIMYGHDYEKNILNNALNFNIPDDYTTGFADVIVNQAFLFPPSIQIDNYTKIGYTLGCRFFMDGNDIYLLHDRENNRVVSINHYS